MTQSSLAQHELKEHVKKLYAKEQDARLNKGE
jgi:hypothetical protein